MTTDSNSGPRTLTPRQQAFHEVIFGVDTPLARGFDAALLVFILLSVVTVILESVPTIQEQYRTLLDTLEWVFTVVFTAEYVLRIWCARRRLRYLTSFYGIVDFLAIIPTYLSLILPLSHTLLTVRALRLLRIFRIFKMGRYMQEATTLRRALYASRQKIAVFILAVATILVIMGSAMYLIEGSVNPDFDSIPNALYWAVVTMTTVGYGDATPITIPGKILAALMMLIGYSMIIVPTGILTVEMSRASSQPMQDEAPPCGHCNSDMDDPTDRFCRECGRALT
jgi:voltage-gated potassium channel